MERSHVGRSEIVSFLLDTNVVSHMVRQPASTMAHRIAALSPDSFAVSVIVTAELQYGAQRRGSRKLTEQLEKVLSAIPTLPLEPPADRHYGAIRTELEQKGQSIGWNDLLIAAHARALGATLISRNVREFSRVSGLQVEDWQVA